MMKEKLVQETKRLRDWSWTEMKMVLASEALEQEASEVFSGGAIKRLGEEVGELDLPLAAMSSFWKEKTRSEIEKKLRSLLGREADHTTVRSILDRTRLSVIFDVAPINEGYVYAIEPSMVCLSETTLIIAEQGYEKKIVLPLAGHDPGFVERLKSEKVIQDGDEMIPYSIAVVWRAYVP